MKIISTALELKIFLKTIEGSVGYVPTMGALHLGHIELIKNAKEQNSCVVVSIFVNPTQFLENEDLSKYPRKEEADKKVCESAGVDVLFLPSVNEIYKEDEVSVVAPNVRGYILEGHTRAGHFNGVLSVVLKLLNIVTPTRAYFGKKDAQQLYLIELMVQQFFLDVLIIPVETHREKDGLAMSSRNIYLSTKEREDALKISHSLRLATSLILQGLRDTQEIISIMRENLSPLKISYIEILRRDFTFIEELEVHNSIILVEVVVGNTRLLDNIWV